MSNFLSNILGIKKSPKIIKGRMQTRKLELIGLEERITPATFTYDGVSNALAIVLNNTNELLTLISQGGGNYVFTSTNTFSGTNTMGLAGNGSTILSITTPLNLANVDITDQAGIAGTDVSFGMNTNIYTVSFFITLNEKGASEVTVSNATAFGVAAGLNVAACRNIIITADLSTNTGTLVLNGDTGIQQTGAFSGVSISGAFVTTAGGDITIIGRGGDVSNNHGVAVTNGGVIRAGGMGIVTVTGIGGAGNFTVGSSVNNVGVFVDGASSAITSSGGAVTVTGTGGGFGASSANDGVRVATGGLITAGLTGTVTVTGTGGVGVGVGTYSGVQVIGNTSRITSSGGAVTVTGTGGTGNIFNYGVCLFTGGVITAGLTGTVTVTGTGGAGGSGFNAGVSVDASSITSSGGAVTVTGTGGLGSFGIDIKTGGIITTNASGAAITFTADSMDFGITSAISSTGTITARNKTRGVAINLGTETAGQLSLTDSELDRITAGTLVIGRSDAGFESGILTVSSALTLGTNIGDLQLIGPVGITLGANVTTNGGQTYTGAVSLGADTTLDITAVNFGGVTTFSSTVDGPFGLTLPVYSTRFVGSVGASTPVSFIVCKNVVDFNGGNNNLGTLSITNVNFNGIQINGQTTIGNLITSDGLYGISIRSGTTTITNFASFINKGTQGNDSLFINNGATLVLTNGGSISGSDLQVSNGTLISGGGLNVSKRVILTNAVINLASGTSSEFSDIADVRGNLTLAGGGKLTLSKVVNTACFINVNAGTLAINGDLSSGTFTVSGGTLGGSGILGGVTFNSGTLAPGNSPGTLTTGKIVLSPQTTFAVEIGTTSTASDLLISTGGNVTLSNAILSVTSVAAGVKIGDSFTIVNAINTTFIDGTFAGLPEGGTVTGLDTLGNTVTFRISYPSNQAVRLKVVALVPVPQDAVFTNGTVVATDALKKFTAVGTDAGGGPLVTITFANGRKTQFFAYAVSFRGGVRVALGNVDGGTDTELVTGPGAGGGPQINVYKVNSATGAVSIQSSFFAFSAPSFTGGVYVAAGDTNADGFADVIVGAGAGGGPRVQVYAGSATGVVTSAPLNDFFAYSSAFTGGVVVAAGQRDAISGDEIITAPASGGGYNIKSFNGSGTGNSPTVVENFFAFNDFTSIGGLSLAVGSLNVGSIADLIIGTSNGGYGVIIDFVTAGITTVPFVGFTGAIRAGVAENAIGQDFAVALAGPRGGPILNTYSVISNNLVLNDSLFILDPAFQGGLFGTPTL